MFAWDKSRTNTRYDLPFSDYMAVKKRVIRCRSLSVGVWLIKKSKHEEFLGWGGSHSEQVGMESGVSVVLRPKVERDGGEFVDERVGEAVLGEVDRFGVGVADVAAFDADLGKLFGSVDRKLGVVFLTAPGTNDAAEFPLGEAETAEQAAAAAVALLAEDSERGFAVAERAQGKGVAVKLQRSAGAEEFGVGLQEGEGEEFLRIRRRLSCGRPAGVQQIRPGTGWRVAQISSD